MALFPIDKPRTDIATAAQEPGPPSPAPADPSGRSWLTERHSAEVSLMVNKEAGFRARAEITTGGLLAVAAIVSAALLGSAVIVQAAVQGRKRRSWRR
jgi:hypothetical protein